MKIVWTLVIATILGAGCDRLNDNKGAAGQAADTTTSAATRADITQSVTSPGTVASNLDVLIKCQAGGQIVKLPYQESDPVKQGDLLVQVDPAPEKRAKELADITLEEDNTKMVMAQLAEQQAELNLATATEQADANIRSAEVKAKNMRLAADRQKQLLDQKLASSEDFETADTAASLAETDLATARIAKEQLKSQAVDLENKKEAVKLSNATLGADKVTADLAKINLDYATVTAPRDGIVTQVLVQVGGMVSSALNNSGGGTTILTLSDMSHIFILATVDESDIGDVRVGQKVEIHADSYPREQFAGIVSLVSHEGVTVSNVVTFQVKIEVTSANKNLLKPQMTADVTIIEAQKKDALLVPVLAVYQKKHQNYVKVVKADGSTEERAVELGISDNNNSEITSGLSGGEKVLVVKNDASRWAASGVPRPRVGRGR